MCQLSDTPLKRKQFTGYKVAVKKNGKYYSPAMGFEYKVGKVPKIRKQKRIGNYFNDCILNKSELSPFKENMVGRTSVFVIKDCRKIRILKKGIKDNVILKITIKKDLLKGFYDGCSVIAGKEITKITEIK